MGIINSTIERRTSLADPAKWLVDLWGGRQTAAGLRVSQRTALNYSAWFCGLLIISNSVAQLPLLFYRRRPDGGKDRATWHPLFKLLHTQACPEVSQFNFRQTLQYHLCSWGNAYAEIEYGKDGYPKALWPLRPDRMKVTRTGQPYASVSDATGEVLYIYTLPGGKEVRLPSYRVFHIPGFGFNGIVGYSLLTLARESVGLGLGTEEYGARFFGNGAKPGGVLEHPGRLKNPTLLRKSWEDMHRGLENQHRIAILEEGMAYKAIGIPPEDAQFLETRQFQVVEVARWLNLPPHMVKDLSRATFSNIEHQGIEYVVHSMMPWYVLWEQNILMRLIPPEEQADHFAEFLVDGLLRGDAKSRNAAYAVQRQNGIINADEWREKENMNPQPDGQGKVYLVNGNMIPTGLAGQKKKIASARRQPWREYQPLFHDAAARIIRREINDVRAAARKYLGKQDVEGLSSWLNDFYQQHSQYVEKNMRPVWRSYHEATNSEQMSGDELEELARVRSAVLGARHAGESRQQLLALLEQDDALALLEERLDQWEEARADEITERIGGNHGT